MKEFDFVKLTLWLSGVLTLALGVGCFVADKMIRDVETDIRKIERTCKDVGLITKDLKTLEDEKRNDKTPERDDTSAIHTYFNSQAKECAIEANADYTLKPREREENRKGGYVDQPFVIDFKKDRPKSRHQIFGFIYNCESGSRRIKLQKARISLSGDDPTQDLWGADSLTFVRRDPTTVAPGN